MCKCWCVTDPDNIKEFCIVRTVPQTFYKLINTRALAYHRECDHLFPLKYLAAVACVTNDHLILTVWHCHCAEEPAIVLSIEGKSMSVHTHTEGGGKRETLCPKKVVGFYEGVCINTESRWTHSPLSKGSKRAYSSPLLSESFIRLLSLFFMYIF